MTPLSSADRARRDYQAGLRPAPDDAPLFEAATTAALLSPRERLQVLIAFAASFAGGLAAAAALTTAGRAAFRHLGL